MAHVRELSCLDLGSGESSAEGLEGGTTVVLIHSPRSKKSAGVKRGEAAAVVGYTL